MEFNWSTFALEIINFIVLVWIVKHFFYKPVRDIVDKRRAKIDEEISNANNLQADAEQLIKDYNNRLINWEEEKQTQQTQLNQELEERKKQQLELIQKQLDEEKEKSDLLQQKKLDLLIHNIERQALDQGAVFTAKLLQELTSPELESRLVELLLANLKNMPPKQKEALANLYNEEKPEVIVTSAYPLSQDQKDKIQESVQQIFSNAIDLKYKESAEVIAGLRINIGSYILRANLADELKFFSDAANGN